MKRLLPLFLLVSCGSSVAATVDLHPVVSNAPQTIVITVPPVTTTTFVLSAEQTQYLQDITDREQAINQMQTAYPKCAEWLPLLVEQGGLIEDWPIWSRVLWTESRCIPTADNGACVGLTQIFYKVHIKWLNSLDIFHDDLYDPVMNLRFAVMLQSSSGWSPWAYLNLP